MNSIAFCSDGSEYAQRLKGELEDLGTTVNAFEDSDDLEFVLDDGLSAVVVVNPRYHRLKAVREALDRAGGWSSRIPLVAALGHPELTSEIEALKYADDFLVTPGGGEELVSRVEVQLVRRGLEGNVITAGELVINIDAHQVLLGGRPVDCTYKEFELLKTLAATPGRAYSREELLRNIWGYDYFGGTRTVDVHVRRLRLKIEKSQRFIETVHGVGYRFVS